VKPLKNKQINESAAENHFYSFHKTQPNTINIFVQSEILLKSSLKGNIVVILPILVK